MGPGLFTSHAHVLFALHRNPDARQREIARDIGITEGAVQRLLNDLTTSGFVTKIRAGRRNHYEINMSAQLRHPITSGRSIEALLNLFAPPDVDQHRGKLQTHR